MNDEYTALEFNLNSESVNAMLDFSPSIRVLITLTAVFMNPGQGSRVFPMNTWHKVLEFTLDGKQ